MTCLRSVLVASILTLAAVGQSVGPDLIAGSIDQVSTLGHVGTTYAYAIGANLCNVGDVEIAWLLTPQNSSPLSPVVVQNIYRLKPVSGQPYSRFEHIGMSWVVAHFQATNQSLCGTCTTGSNDLLGIGCSTPHNAWSNGIQDMMIPRDETNPVTGDHRWPIGTGYPSPYASVINRRLQCEAADVDPAQNVGAGYFGEVQYVSFDDSRAGNQNNNASYRPVWFEPGTFLGHEYGVTTPQQPGVLAWQATDPSVAIQYVDWPNDGRFIIAKRITNLGGGQYHYEFAVQNLNSHRSGKGFAVTFPAGTAISNAGFKDIGYHSGEPYSGTDWTVSVNGSIVNWTTDSYAVNPNANALRWGTLYNFWFDATAPFESSKTIEPFRCPTDTPVQPAHAYTLDTNAPFDDPPIVGVNGPLGGNDYLTVPIGFPFNFYGTSYTSVSISSKGYLAFSTQGLSTYAITGIPVATAPHGVIAGYWADLNLSTGQIKYATIGNAPNRRFVVHYGLPGGFKIILGETTNKITSLIISTQSGLGAVRGIEAPNGLEGIQASRNQPGSAVGGTSQTYTPIFHVLPSASLAVSGSAGPNGVLTWDLDSSVVGGAVVLIASTDPGPTDLGPIGIAGIGFFGQFAVLADGAGLLGIADPNDVTITPCGTYSISIPVGPIGLPPGIPIYSQGVVLPSSSPPPLSGPPPPPPPPNGVFHLTNVALLNT